MNIEIKTEAGFNYIDQGKGKTMLLLHGLFGALSNWESVINAATPNYRVIIPILPIHEMPLRSATLDGLLSFIDKFIEHKQLTDILLFGNSLGGHLALLYTLKRPEKVKCLVLTGSSGLFENGMGGSYPKRGDYEFIKERVAYTFYDPKVADKELVDEVFEITRSIPKCMSMVSLAKSAQRHNLSKDLYKLDLPTLLVWGLNDTITPPLVAHEFNRLIKNSELRFIDKCCHAPMMEQPDIFNQYFQDFLKRNS